MRGDVTRNKAERRRIMRIRPLAISVGSALLLLIGAAQGGTLQNAAAGAPTAAATRNDDDDGGTSAADRIRATEIARLRAVVQADISTARKFFATDFQLINPLGAPMSLEELLGALAAGSLDFLVDEPISPIDVRVFGREAVLRYQAKIELVAFGQHLAHKAWHTMFYERRHSQWQLVWEQTTGVPNNVGLVIEALKPSS
jgi:hypothetical protein